MTNELGNPSNDMDTQSNLLGLRVGFEEVGGVLGKSEEDGCSKELQTKITIIVLARYYSKEKKKRKIIQN